MIGEALARIRWLEYVAKISKGQRYKENRNRVWKTDRIVANQKQTRAVLTTDFTDDTDSEQSLSESVSSVKSVVSLSLCPFEIFAKHLNPSVRDRV